MNKKHLIFIFLILAPGLAFLAVGVRIYDQINWWRYDGPSTVFEVKPGESFSSVNYRLKKQELISSSKIFYRYAKINDLMTKIKAGKFEIAKDSNMLDVFETLINGKAIAAEVTVPEGKNLFEIAEILEKNKVIKSAKEFIRLSKDEEFVQSLGVPANRIEGYLYPDTYHFNEAMPEKQVIKTMVELFKKRTSDLDFSNAPFSKHKVIILASMVEKETGASFERPVIAGVFHNRLKKRMRLQSDPTTIYGIYENFNGNLRKKHLLEKTPYNTYKIPGLPIGPISNPGLESIKAVLNPQKHDYLYFVSKNDGTHIFSKSYKDHVNAVNKWQKTQSNRKGRSWRDLNKDQ